MAPPSTPLHDELAWRGLLHQQTEGCAEALAKGPVVGYCGFDPTAESLHVGNLVSLMGLVRLAQAGHTAMALVGGGTAMIGDPSGKSEERPMRAVKEIRANAKLIEIQIRRVAANALGAAAARRFVVKDNAAWLGTAKLIPFLRDIGKHFTVNWMMQKDSVKSRMETGISFTEFSYMLLQAYDFQRLHEDEGVTLQIGGSDQWGNITAGTELIRRTVKGDAHGLTFPLLTDASGKKFGKTEAGAVWLDAGRTSPYQFYQYWINQDDADVGRLLRTFTLLGRAEIERVESAHAAALHERGGQKALASAVTKLVHGAEAAELAETVSRTVFDRKTDAHALSDKVFKMLASEMPSVELRPTAEHTLDVVTALEQAFAVSRTAARKLIQQGGVSVNGAKLAPEAAAVPEGDAVRKKWLLIRKGGREIAVGMVVRALLLVLALAGAQARADAQGTATILVPGMELVYQANGREGPPWRVTTVVSGLAAGGKSGCLRVELAAGGPRPGADVRVTCEESGILFSWDSVSTTWRASRPVGPRMQLEVRSASGNVSRYETLDELEVVVSGQTVRAVETVIVTVDTTGKAVRRLRERYAPTLGTAVWGAFESPDGSGGWTVQQEFRLAAIRMPR